MPSFRPRLGHREPVDRELLASVRALLGPCARLLVTSKGTPLIRDQQLDIFSRYALPIAYTILLASYMARIPYQPDQAAALLAPCALSCRPTQILSPAMLRG